MKMRRFWPILVGIFLVFAVVVPAKANQAEEWSVKEPLRCFTRTLREYKKIPSGVIQQRIYVYDNVTGNLHHKEYALYKASDKYVWPGEGWFINPINFGSEYGFVGKTWWVYWVTDTENGDLYFPSQFYKWCAA